LVELLDICRIDTALSFDIIDYYEERAKGGAGLIYTFGALPNAGIEPCYFAQSVFAQPESFSPEELLKAFNKTDWNKAKAARMLCIGRQRSNIWMLWYTSAPVHIRMMAHFFEFSPNVINLLILSYIIEFIGQNN
jgi:2,4-dienoyl-CoA reductase-like NADH-dependent reductase (Old Yellow Enzyme family)